MPLPPVVGGGIIIYFEKKLSKFRRKILSFFVYARKTIMPIKSKTGSSVKKYLNRLSYKTFRSTERSRIPAFARVTLNEA